MEEKLIELSNLLKSSKDIPQMVYSNIIALSEMISKEETNNRDVLFQCRKIMTIADNEIYIIDEKIMVLISEMLFDYNATKGFDQSLLDAIMEVNAYIPAKKGLGSIFSMDKENEEKDNDTKENLIENNVIEQNITEINKEEFEDINKEIIEEDIVEEIEQEVTKEEIPQEIIEEKIQEVIKEEIPKEIIEENIIIEKDIIEEVTQKNIIEETPKEGDYKEIEEINKQEINKEIIENNELEEKIMVEDNKQKYLYEKDEIFTYKVDILYELYYDILFKRVNYKKRIINPVILDSLTNIEYFSNSIKNEVVKYIKENEKHQVKQSIIKKFIKNETELLKEHTTIRNEDEIIDFYISSLSKLSLMHLLNDIKTLKEESNSDLNDNLFVLILKLINLIDDTIESNSREINLKENINFLFECIKDHLPNIEENDYFPKFLNCLNLEKETKRNFIDMKLNSDIEIVVNYELFYSVLDFYKLSQNEYDKYIKNDESILNLNNKIDLISINKENNDLIIGVLKSKRTLAISPMFTEYYNFICNMINENLELSGQTSKYKNIESVKDLEINYDILSIMLNWKYIIDDIL